VIKYSPDTHLCALHGEIFGKKHHWTWVQVMVPGSMGSWAYYGTCRVLPGSAISCKDLRPIVMGPGVGLWCAPGLNCCIVSSKMLPVRVLAYRWVRYQVLVVPGYQVYWYWYWRTQMYLPVVHSQKDSRPTYLVLATKFFQTKKSKLTSLYIHLYCLWTAKKITFSYRSLYDVDKDYARMHYFVIHCNIEIKCIFDGNQI